MEKSEMRSATPAALTSAGQSTVDPVVLERALEETVDRIERAAAARIGSVAVGVKLSSEARDRLKMRYRPMFEDAMKNGRKWEDDRGRVLLRADQVGYVAAFGVLAMSILLEFKRAGVGELPGQEIELEPVTPPSVNGRLAELAASVIDCQKPHTPGRVELMWDWCSRTGDVSFGQFLTELFRSQFSARESASSLHSTVVDALAGNGKD